MITALSPRLAVYRSFSSSSSQLLPPARYATPRASPYQAGDPGPQTSRARQARRSEPRGPSQRDRRSFESRSIDNFSNATLPRSQQTGPTPNRRSPPSYRPASASQRFFGPTTKRNKRNLVQPLNPFDTSRKLRALIASVKSPVPERTINDAVTVVMSAPREAVSAPVWNQLFAFLGREGRLDKMWKLFNDMKKRGVKPTSRTYTTLLNAMAGVIHSSSMSRSTLSTTPPKSALERATSIYDQSQRHIRQYLTSKASPASAPSDIGLVIPGVDLRGPDPDSPSPAEHGESEVSLGPTNAYLKFLGRYAMWQEMDKIFLAMDTEGPLAPDNITYSTVLSGLLNRDLPPAEHGSRARAIWDRAVRQFYGTITSKPGGDPGPADERGRNQRIDGELAILGLSALLRGRASDRQLAVDLLPYFYDLPTSPASSPASSSSQIPSRPTRLNAAKIPPAMQPIPPMSLDIRAATSILSMLARANENALASSCAQAFIADPKLIPRIDHPFLHTAIRTLSTTADVKSIRSIMDSYRPPPSGSGENWPSFVWDSAIGACRWKGDWETCVIFWRRMTFMPYGVEKGDEKTRKYVFRGYNGKEVDVQGMRWIAPSPRKPTAKQMSLLMKTALAGMSTGRLTEAWNIWKFYGESVFFRIPAREWKGEDVDMLQAGSEDVIKGSSAGDGLREAAEWRVDLALDVAWLVDGLKSGRVDSMIGQDAGANEGEVVREWEDVGRRMRDVGARWMEVKSNKPRAELVRGARHVRDIEPTRQVGRWTAGVASRKVFDVGVVERRGGMRKREGRAEVI